MIGRTISHYKIIEELGSGGMGVVYKAEDTKLKRMVALKFLPPALTRDKEAKQRFMQEAQAASALDHPNIGTIYEIDAIGRGQMFIAMAYYGGKSLEDKIQRGPLPVEEAINTAMQIAQGLAKAHEKSIVHRDIKPANIMLTEDGQVKIVDFGLAKLSSGTRLTKTGTAMGTLAYTSPEQARGEEVDHRTDIWASGIVLYQMLTAQLPFIEDHEAAIIYAILNESPSPPTEIRNDIPADLEKIVLKCLRKDQKDRYPSAQHLFFDLNKLKKALEAEKYKSKLEQKDITKKDKGTTERRQATVMFAEIYGYSEMLEKMGAEEVNSIMNSCFEMFGSIVEKYGGRIDKITGSGLMALFGVPVAIESAPHKAINAAIEMRSELNQFNKEKNLSIPLELRIGINTGIVVAGPVGSGKKKEFTVIGDTVTLASTLKDLAGKGQVYVGPFTHRHTKNDFEYKPVKPITLKGKIKSLPAFELLSTTVRIYATGLVSEQMVYSEMVGREKELNKLELHVLRVINGEGSIVSVIGEAGIGKSRLITELKSKDVINRVRLLEGRALSFGKNLSYHPIIDILKKWAAIKEDDTETESISKLEKAIGNIYPEGVAEVFPFIATLMGMKLNGKYADRIKGIEGEAMEKLILKNTRELMIKAAEHNPIVYIIEDLHWADLTSIELLESLFRLAESQKILFINVLRPDYQETGDRILETLKERCGNFHSEIYLEPLDEKQCEVLIENLTKASELPRDISTAIANRAEGNPFFIEEVVHSFIDEGVIELKDGKFKVTEKIVSVVIPETIQEVLMARIDRLDENTRALLKVASVLGRHFFYKVLAEVAKTIEHIDERLEYLKRVQLIRERRRLDEVEYFFKNALAQEVTYESILLRKRKVLHLQAAKAIESVFSKRLHEFYGMLAMHYSRADEMEKTEEYLIKAGEEALKAAASTEALNYYQQALKLYLQKSEDAADREKRAILEKNIALAFYNKGYMAEAMEHFDKTLECLGEKISKNTFIQASKFLINLSSVLINLYRPSKKKKKALGKKDIEILELLYKRGNALANIDSKRFFIETMGLFRKLNRFDLKGLEGAGGMYSGGSALFSLTGISFSISQKFLDVSKRIIGKNEVKSILLYKFFEGVHNYFAGNWDSEYEIDEELINATLRLGELYMVTLYVGTCFHIALGCGEFEYATGLIDKVSKISESYDYDWGRLYRHISELKYRLEKREFDDDLKFVDQSLNLANKLGLRLWNIRTLGLKAKAQILLKDLKGAEESLLKAKQILSECGRITPHYIREYTVNQFLLYVSQLEEMNQADSLTSNKLEITDLKKRAHKSSKDALKISHKVAEKMPETLRLIGTLNWLENKQKKALKYWDKSIKNAEHLGARPELARTFAEVGTRLLEKKSRFQQLNGIPAKEYLENAQALFKDMQLAWDLRELNKTKSHAESLA